MRAIILVALLSILAACAASHPTQSTAKPAGAHSRVAEAPNMTDEEIKSYITDLADERLKAICGDRPTLSSQFQCASDAIFRGFDTTGEAKRNCDSNQSMDSLMRCAVMGSMGYQLAIDEGLDEANNFNWQDPEQGLRGTLDALAKKHVSDCMSSALATIDRCVMDRLGKSLSLSEQQIASCTDPENSDKSLQCLIRVHLLDRFETAIWRMGNGGAQRA